MEYTSEIVVLFKRKEEEIIRKKHIELVNMLQVYVSNDVSLDTIWNDDYIFALKNGLLTYIDNKTIITFLQIKMGDKWILQQLNNGKIPNNLVTKIKDSNVTDHDLKNANFIEELSAKNNPNITNVFSFSKSLKYLDASGSKCGLNDFGLKDAFYIEELNAFDNEKITNTKTFQTSIKKLNASYNCGIDDSGLFGNIEELNARENSKITNVNKLIALRKLDASGYQCGITNDGLNLLSSLTDLNVSENPKITKLGPYKNSLQTLSIGGFNCKIGDDELQNTTNIIHLVARYNPNIKNIKSYSNALKVLDVSGPTCEMTDDGLNGHNLYSLIADYNKSVKLVVDRFHY